MDKKRIAVIFGGRSTEYEVSLQSAYSVLKNIDRDLYDVIPIGITRDGEWYRYGGSLERIPEDTWADDSEELHAVAFSQNCRTRGFLEFIKRLLMFRWIIQRCL